MRHRNGCAACGPRFCSEFKPVRDGTMSLWGFLRRLLFGPEKAGRRQARPSTVKSRRRKRRRKRVRLAPLRFHSDPKRRSQPVGTGKAPYRFARLDVTVRRGARQGYLDLAQDGDRDRLQRWGLPEFSTPDELADWLGLHVGRVAWLIDRVGSARRSPEKAHYAYHVVPKRRGGWRLIQAPKPVLKAVQTQILEEILNRVPPHDAAHGFVRGRSIVTNARPHVGRRVIVKFDLFDFYTTIRLRRVAAIFRGMGYSREAAIWLARLTTTDVPFTLQVPGERRKRIGPYRTRHLPQGAPTSPAIANLSAYSLDVRLSGMARAFGANYTRYADDLTFSGPRPFLRSLSTFLPLAEQIVRSERFSLNLEKRKVIRSNQRQEVTGVVVNERLAVCRRDYDRLKAILHNCIRHGPSSQNREGVTDFRAHLAGRIAHVRQVDPKKGARLQASFDQIQW